MSLGSQLRGLFADERVQIAYGIGVMLLVPAVIVLNVMAVVGRYSESTDVALQRSALLVGRTVGATLASDPGAITGTLAAIRQASPDVQQLQFLAPGSDAEFTVVASADPAEFGTRYASPFLALAWGHPEGEALAVDSLVLPPLSAPTTVTAPNGRFWLVALPVFATDALGGRQRSGLLLLRLSADVVDELTRANWTSAVFWLAVTVLLLVLFWGRARGCGATRGCTARSARLTR